MPHPPTASLHDGVLVFDARHGDWVGIGDSASRILALLRIGQYLRVKPFIWMNACADVRGPARRTVARRSNGSECSFDAGEWFESVSGDWQWTGIMRRFVTRTHKEEHVIGYSCERLGDGGVCLEARVPFDAGHELDALRHALRIHRWVRLELTAIDDFRSIGDAFQHTRRCDFFAAWRPKKVLWTALAPHLTRAAEWNVLGGIAVRTGLADHADLFRPASERVPFDIESVMRLFTACPPGTTPVSRVASAHNAPCVNYQSHAELPRFSPGDGRYFELAVYAQNVSGAASLMAGGGSWGIATFTDSPAVHCALRGLIGSEHVLETSHPVGHTQYSADREVALTASVDFYLVGLMDFIVELFPSKFSGVGSERRLAPPARTATPPVLSHGWPQFFTAGNERELMSRTTPSKRDARVVKTLMQTC